MKVRDLCSEVQVLLVEWFPKRLQHPYIPQTLLTQHILNRLYMTRSFHGTPNPSSLAFAIICEANRVYIHNRRAMDKMCHHIQYDHLSYKDKKVQKFLKPLTRKPIVNLNYDPYTHITNTVFV